MSRGISSARRDTEKGNHERLPFVLRKNFGFLKQPKVGYDSPLGDLCLFFGYIQRMQKIIRQITNTIPKIAVNTETTERVFGFEYSNVTFFF